MTPSTESQAISISLLRSELTGRVVTPDDADYDAMRTVVSGAVDRRPALIARVADAKDVATVIALARRTGMELAIRRYDPTNLFQLNQNVPPAAA